MLTKNIDFINFFLLILAFILAIIFPFELFLFSYAVLGPAHYLTELNWLKKNNFFTINKNGVRTLLIIASVLSIIVLLNFTFKELNYNIKINNSIYYIFLLTSFFYVIFLLNLKEKKYHFIGFITIVAFSFLLVSYFNKAALLFGLLLTTIIHVYVFTIFFMIYGTLKKPNLFGYINIIIISIIPIIIYYFPYFETNTSFITNKIFNESGFNKLNTIIKKLLYNHSNKKFTETKAQIFIAFAYTYHYLNWFSKTTVIGWSKNLTKKSIAIILLFWLLSIVLYFIDYKLGIITLFFLSLWHVIAEFPLNIISIKSILYKILNYSK